jgi:hypothetical protein
MSDASATSSPPASNLDELIPFAFDELRRLGSGRWPAAPAAVALHQPAGLLTK